MTFAKRMAFALNVVQNLLIMAALLVGDVEWQFVIAKHLLVNAEEGNTFVLYADRRSNGIGSKKAPLCAARADKKKENAMQTVLNS